ncbi:MAG: ABC transporter ATP-binding protein [Wenzhouxiangellaceae bacterium]
MLSIKNLSHVYPNGVKALNNINLELPKGMFGLLGPNGAGKSTLMRTLATLQLPTTGWIKFNQIDVLNDADGLRRVLGYLPQDFGVYPRGSAYELLNHLAVLKGIINPAQRKTVVNGLLAQTNLYEVKHKRVATFSGGMRQRFGIAQALIGQPQLIIVDEPTAGLDPEERRRFHNLLAAIGEEIVVILSTHIVDDVADLCPNMAILAAGEIVAQGTPDSLIAGLEGQIWKRTVDKSQFDTITAQHRLVSHHLSAGRIMIRVHSDRRPDTGFEAAAPTLEDVYFLTVRQVRDVNQQATVQNLNVAA